MASTQWTKSTFGRDTVPDRSQREAQKHPLRTCVPASGYASSWSCRWTIPGNGLLSEHDLDLLRHVNCSYLSADKPPTLLSLKQHTQSLTILIRKLSVSTKFGIPDAGNQPEGTNFGPEALRFRQNEAFDWLNNLDEAYTTDDPSHYVPLSTIHNDIRGESNTSGPLYHCPLAEAQDLGPPVQNDKPVCRPRMTRHALTMHANECLEILDHELSAIGGLMALLPTPAEDDGEEMAGARNTLLGQWLLHQQHLVGRMHKLEISYANALDVLAKEAVVPAQLLSKTSFEARSGGRKIAFPQDTYVLVNSGDEITEQVHEILDESETGMEHMERVHQARGVCGDRMWEQHSDSDEVGISRGLVSVDLLSRFYRVKGLGHESSIFLLPAIERHGGVVRTREMEKGPTVVSLVTPQWPMRVTEWEKKYRARLERASEIEFENHKLVCEVDELKRRVEEMEVES